MKEDVFNLWNKIQILHRLAMGRRSDGNFQWDIDIGKKYLIYIVFDDTKSQCTNWFLDQNQYISFFTVKYQFLVSDNLINLRYLTIRNPYYTGQRFQFLSAEITPKKNFRLLHRIHRDLKNLNRNYLIGIDEFILRII